jgi:hypothetical protein
MMNALVLHFLVSRGGNPDLEIALPRHNAANKSSLTLLTRQPK